MKTLVSGSSGLVGSALVTDLARAGHDVIRLVRSPRPDDANAVPWDPHAGNEINDARLEDLDAVIHLAGENLFGRWTADKKAAIRASRVHGTTVLSQTLAGLQHKPRVLLSASAIGYYGDTGDREVDESSPSGDGFLAAVCRDWEAAATPAADAGIRVVNLRIGVVLDPVGGALGKMLPVFRAGLGGPAGSGRQYMSWISLRDLVRAIAFLMTAEQVSGPVNLVAPGAVTNREFSRTLARVVHRPAFLPVPATALRVLYGEFADQTLLASGRVASKVLPDAGFAFKDPSLEDILRSMLEGKNAPLRTNREPMR